jgi:hypothetical protein
VGQNIAAVPIENLFTGDSLFRERFVEEFLKVLRRSRRSDTRRVQGAGVFSDDRRHCLPQPLMLICWIVNHAGKILTLTRNWAKDISARLVSVIRWACLKV